MVQNPPLILFAERDIAWSRPVRIELRRRGAGVLMSRSVADTLRVVERLVPDLLVLDAELEPQGAGPLLQSVRRRSERTAIILLANQIQDGLMSACRAADVLRCITEPRRQDELIDAISSHFAGRLAAANDPTRRSPLIMCVDDDRLYLRSLERLLNRRGYRVTTFDNPERALDSLAQVGPDMAIVDIRMPNMNGLNLAEEMSEAYGGRLPIVVLSALSADETISDAYRRGVSYYVTKPCEPSTMVNVVDYFVGDLDAPERELLKAQM